MEVYCKGKFDFPTPSKMGSSNVNGSKKVHFRKITLLILQIIQCPKCKRAFYVDEIHATFSFGQFQKLLFYLFLQLWFANHYD